MDDKKRIEELRKTLSYHAYRYYVMDAPEIPDNQVLLTYIIEKLDGVVGEEYSEPFGQGRIKIVEEAPAA